MRMATESRESIQHKLLDLPCHFSWESLQNVGRTVDMNIANLEEHIDETIQGTEVKSYNLMGFYKTQQEHFEEARANFEDALKYSKTEDDRIVSLGCLAWLTWKESSSDSSSEVHIVEWISQVQNILRGRNSDDIPEVLAEKAFAIANSGFTEKGFKVALDCINKALEKRSDDVMYKFTKAILLQQFYHKKHKNKSKDDAEIQKIKQIWEELIASLETKSTIYPVIYGQALVKYALFLCKINRDNGASGKKYVDKAIDVARSHQATAVMRNVARFYTLSAGGKSYSDLCKAELILEELIGLKPDGDYKVLTELAHCFFKQFEISPRSAIATFKNAEEYFRKAWELNKKYLTPGLNLIRLYQMKYYKTEDVSALLKAEKIFQELFLNYETTENLYKAMIWSAFQFGEFMKGYGIRLASFYLQCYHAYQGGVSAKSSLIEQALQLIHQFKQDKQDEYLLKAEQVFKQLYNNLEMLEDTAVKARFHKEYAAFLDKFSNDLAFCCLTKCLEHNPHEGYAYKPLEELARVKIASPDKKEQIKGERTLEWIAQLQEGQLGTEVESHDF